MGSTGASRPSLDQRRAAHAWGAVSEAKKLKEKEQEDYRRAAKKMPAQIVTAGLGQALAFVKAKAKADELVESLSSWICRDRRIYDGSSSLLEAIIHGNSSQLRHATEECMLYLQWLNRFAETELKDSEQGAD